MRTCFANLIKRQHKTQNIYVQEKQYKLRYFGSNCKTAEHIRTCLKGLRKLRTTSSQCGVCICMDKQQCTTINSLCPFVFRWIFKIYVWLNYKFIKTYH